MRRHRGYHSPYPKSSNSPLSEAAGLIRTFNSETNPARPVRPSPLARSAIPDMPLDMLDKIRSFPLFQSAPEEFLVAIGSYLRPQTQSSHDYILTEGDDAKAMYWLYRGAVAVTSRDGEATYFELKPGAFFGEIGILMGIPRTATIVARTKCLLVQLKKEDLFKVLPRFPEVERAIREEAQERLAILENKKKENSGLSRSNSSASRGGKRAYEEEDDADMTLSDGPRVRHYSFSNNKKRKSPSPGLVEVVASSALGTGSVHIRQLLRELPLFSNLPSEILHFLGSNAQQRTYAPFTDIIRQGSQGREVYFIVRGEVEVLDERPLKQTEPKSTNAAGRQLRPTANFKARLKQGSYFGEVASLSLAPRRTATVRAISLVECLLITGEVLQRFWEKCPEGIRQQVEQTAKERLSTTEENDVIMRDVVEATPAINELAIGDPGPAARRTSIPQVVFDQSIFEHARTDGISRVALNQKREVKEPVDPDPYLIPDLDNVRARSRRSSLAPVSPDAPQENGEKQAVIRPKHTPTQLDPTIEKKRPKLTMRSSSLFDKGPLPKNILISIFDCLELHELMYVRLVSRKWAKLIRESSDLLHHLNLSFYNKRVTDKVIKEVIGPFVGRRPRCIDISNCFHITDDGFTALAVMCGQQVTSWKMKSVWDVSAVAIHEMVKTAKELQDVDLSNCRKVNDALLMHVIGNVPLLPPPSQVLSPTSQNYPPTYRPYPSHPRQPSPFAQQQQQAAQQQHQQHPSQPPIPIILGSQKLKKLTLSYCKHVTDRSMAHIGTFARSRLEEVDLTRCTTITDHGFEAWGQHQFDRLTKLCLADCTYLTDNAIVFLTNAAPGLRYLDLSFCCALSDTATEVLSLSCSHLAHLNLSFCGSAVSDSSLRSIGLHLLEMRFLSVRGCVRVTGAGVESVVEGCHKLEAFDVSQCRNLGGWLGSGGMGRVRRGIRWCVVQGVW